MRTVGLTNSRMRLRPVVKNSRAATALRPFQGSAAAWAVRPLNSTMKSMMAWELSTATWVLSPGCQFRQTSRSLKTPSRTM